MPLGAKFQQDETGNMDFPKSKYNLATLIVVIYLLGAIHSQNAQPTSASSTRNGSSAQIRAEQQPLAGLEKLFAQTGGLGLSQMVDSRSASNLTDKFNEMAMNVRKIIEENQRLNSQIRELLVGVQNSTGVNATNSMNSIQQQLTSVTKLTKPQ